MIEVLFFSILVCYVVYIIFLSIRHITYFYFNKNYKKKLGLYPIIDYINIFNFKTVNKTEIKKVLNEMYEINALDLDKFSEKIERDSTILLSHMMVLLLVIFISVLIS